jgi:hypothetical protein
VQICYYVVAAEVARIIAAAAASSNFGTSPRFPCFGSVVTLSTLPHHMEWLSPTLESLTSQSLRPDDILLALPIRSQRTGKPYGNITVPEVRADSEALRQAANAKKAKQSKAAMCEGSGVIVT